MIRLTEIVVKFCYGDGQELRALDNLSLTVEKGEFVVVVGNNGAGKSTLLNVLAGTLPVFSGKVEMDGVDITHWPDYRRAGWISRVFPNPAEGTCGAMSILENFAVALRRGKNRNLAWFIRADEKQYIREQISILELGLENRLNTPMELLSSGQRQSLSVLMATLIQPKLLLLDEHVANLDPGTQDLVMGITNEIIQENGLTALMVTHDMEDALRYGNRLLAMERGRIILDVKGEEKKQVSLENLRAIYRKDQEKLGA